MTTRTDPAKAAAIEEYLALYEYHCEREQLERDGHLTAPACHHPDAFTPEDRATAHHEAALQVLWSMDAEQQDPRPPGLRE